MPKVAGIDSSTQSCKIVVCDADTGEVLAARSSPHPDGTECPPHAWWSALQDAGDGLLEDVDAVGVAGQQHGMVTLDEHDDEVRPALLWNDTRSAAAAAQLVERLGGAQAWAEAVGSVPLASMTVSKLAWLAEHEPANADRVARVMLPHDYLTWQLCGRPATAVTDRGDASGTAYWSPVTGDYRTDLLELAFGRTPELPRVLGPAEPAGQTPAGAVVVGRHRRQHGRRARTRHRARRRRGLAGHERHGLRGARQADHRRLGVRRRVRGRDRAVPPARLHPQRGAGPHRDGGDAGSRHRAVQPAGPTAAPGAGGLVLLPYLDGERTPNLPDAAGSLHNLRRDAMTPENLARAAVEGMLCGLADGLDALRTHGVAVRRVLLIGGAARSPAVQAVAPTVFGVPVSVPPPAEYVALGAARQAAWALAGRAEPPVWSAGEVTVRDDVDASAGHRIRSAYAEAREALHG